MSIELVEDSQVDAAWLTEQLRAAGHSAVVERVTATGIGTGQVGQNVRFEMAYAAGTDSGAPASVVGKFPSDSALSRETAVMTGSYLREVGFYQQIASTLDVRTPAIYAAAIDDTAGRFVLLMEDLVPAAQADQLAGCSLEQARLAMIEAARMHAPRWNDSSLATLPWLTQPPSRESLPEAEAFLQHCFAGFAERYRAALEPEYMEVARQFVAGFAHWYLGYEGPLALIHCDYRPDNLLFGGPYPLTVVDWQTCAYGAPSYDVSYFLGAGVLPELRREHEQSLVREYHQQLQQLGVTGYEFADCWLDYRFHAFTGLRMAIGASMIVERTERGDAMFMAMASRHAQQALDLGALEFLG